MSIVIRSDEVNVLIYKYLQECNLNHTAFAFYNQAALSQVLIRYKFDLKSGHLLSFLEKALIFCQIQSHTTISEYEECKQEISLLKPHICSIVEKVKKDNEKLMQQFNEQIYTTMRRTSSIHHTLMPNKQFEQIVYEQRPESYLDRVTTKLHDVEDGNITIKGSSSFNIIYQSQGFNMTITKKDDNVSLQNIIPCIVNNNLAPLKAFQIIDNHIIRVYGQNVCEIIKNIEGDQYQVNQQFKIPMPQRTQITKILQNKRIPCLVTLTSENSYCIVNTNKDEKICEGNGKFRWRLLDQYLTQNSSDIKLFSLKKDEPLLNFISYTDNISNMEVSPSKIYFFTESILDNQVSVYTFEKQQPLYIFNSSTFAVSLQNNNNESSNMIQSDQKEEVIQTLWISGNSIDYLIMLTNLSIRTFEIQLNSYTKIVQISKYDKKISKIQYLKKQNDEVFIIGLGEQNIIVYDVCQGKIERIQKKKIKQSQIEEQVFENYEMFQINNNNQIALRGPGNIYFLKDSDLQNLFK